MDEYGGRSFEDVCHEVRPERVVAHCLAADKKDAEIMQVTLVRMVGSVDSQNGMVARGRRTPTPSGQVNADAVAYDCAGGRPHGKLVSGTLLTAVGRGREAQHWRRGDGRDDCGRLAQNAAR